MTRAEEQIIRHGAAINAFAQNEPLMEAFLTIAKEEIRARERECIRFTRIHDFQNALAQASAAEGIEDFLTILDGVASKYRVLRTSETQ